MPLTGLQLCLRIYFSGLNEFLVFNPILVFNILGIALRNKMELWTCSPGRKLYIQLNFIFCSWSSWASPLPTKHIYDPQRATSVFKMASFKYLKRALTHPFLSLLYLSLDLCSLSLLVLFLSQITSVLFLGQIEFGSMSLVGCMSLRVGHCVPLIRTVVEEMYLPALAFPVAPRQTHTECAGNLNSQAAS